MLTQGLVGLGEIARQNVSRPCDDVRRASLLAAREVEQHTTQMPSSAGPFTPHERVTVRAEARVELALGDAEATGGDGRIARERATERRGHGRARAVVEGVPLRGQQTKRPLGVSELPPRVVAIAVGAVLRQPLQVGIKRLTE